MQRMHQSYKCMKAQQKKLSGCASNLLTHEDLGHLRKPIVGIYKPSSIMKNSHQYMKVTKQKTLYYKDHGATLKHKCGKRIVTLLLFFFFFFGGLLWPPFLFRLLWPFLFFLFFFFFMGQCSIMMIITLLFTYNSILQLDTGTKI